MTDKAQRLEQIEYKEQEAYRYSDGSVRNASGHWLDKPPGAAVVIDKVRSQELHDRKAAKRDREQAEFKAEVQRALVANVAGAKTPGGAVAKWYGHFAAEMDQATGPKEHGLLNYVKAAKEGAIVAGLIEEKKHETLNVDKLALIVTPGTREHVEGLLQKLAAASGDDSSAT